MLIKYILTFSRMNHAQIIRFEDDRPETANLFFIIFVLTFNIYTPEMTVLI